jgi:hypothetical protein
MYRKFNVTRNLFLEQYVFGGTKHNHSMRSATALALHCLIVDYYWDTEVLWLHNHCSFHLI